VPLHGRQNAPRFRLCLRHSTALRTLCHMIQRLLGAWLLTLSLVLGACTPSTDARHSEAVAPLSSGAVQNTTVSPGPSPGASTSPNPAKRGPPLFLWRTVDTAATVYLLGSIHVGTADLYPLDSRIEDAFAQADTLVVEVDTDDEQLAEVIPGFVRKALLPPGQSAFDGLPPAVVERLRAKMSRLQLMPEQLEVFAPWFVTMTISMKEIEASGYSAQYGIDRHFLERARGKLPIVSLERAEDQMQLLLNMDDELQREDLARVADEDQGQGLGRLLDYWRRGDTEALQNEMTEFKTEYPRLFEQLFTKRNLAMAAQIEAFSRKHGVHFVVVGSGHLVGPGSVVDDLRQSGIRVVQQ